MVDASPRRSRAPLIFPGRFPGRADAAVKLAGLGSVAERLNAAVLKTAEDVSPP